MSVQHLEPDTTDQTARGRYLAARAAFAARSGARDLWPTVDAWPLYVGLGNLARSLVLIEAAQHALTVPGDWLEFGSWRGATLSLLAKVLELRAPRSSVRVHGFDTFEGFSPEATEWGPRDARDRAAPYAGGYRGNLDELRALCALYDLERIVLHVGRVEDTWPEARQTIAHVALVYLDVDLYAPTSAALEGLHERLSPGAVILADEYGLPEWPGETAAIDEFLIAHPGMYDLEPITTASQPTVRITRR